MVATPHRCFAREAERLGIALPEAGHYAVASLFLPQDEATRATMEKIVEEAIAAEGDGFALAEVDLTIRGEGEILGTRQHGLPRFRAASLPEDTSLLLEARRRVLELRDRFGSLEAPGVGPLMDEARRRFGDERVEQLAA